jgi:hypothetical protein
MCMKTEFCYYYFSDGSVYTRIIVIISSYYLNYEI